jgi:flagellar hook assembly protein FlgD
MTFSAVVSRGGKIVINDLMNYPNPMTSNTEFFFELNAPADWAEMQIFTLSGKLIKRIHSGNLTVGRNRGIRWDGCDLDGDRVAEGVYIYRLTAQGMVTQNGGSADTNAEAFGKLVVLN